MSNEALDAVKYCSKAKGSARLVLTMIADGTNRETECYRPGLLDDLAELCNCSVRETQHQINGRKGHKGGLIALGELVVEQARSGKCTYWIPILEGEPGYLPVECHETHFCNGYHTRIGVLRAQEKRNDVKGRRAAWRQQMRERKAADKASANGEQVCTPDDEVNRCSPPGEQVFTHEMNTCSPPGEQVFIDAIGITQLVPITTQVETHAHAREASPLSEKHNEAEAEAEGGAMPAPYDEAGNPRWQVMRTWARSDEGRKAMSRARLLPPYALRDLLAVYSQVQERAAAAWNAAILQPRAEGTG